MEQLRHRAISSVLTFVYRMKIILLATLLSGCAASSGSMQSFEMVEPRANHGWILDNENEPQLQQLVAGLDNGAPDLAALSTQPPAAVDDRPSGGTFFAKADSESSSENATPDADSEGTTNTVGLPENSGQLLMLPPLNPTELLELIDSLQLEFQTTRSYREAAPSESNRLPPIPSGVADTVTLIKTTGSSTQFIRLGLRHFLSQPARLWTQGTLRVSAESPWGLNPDLTEIPTFLESVLKAMEEMKQQLAKTQLTFELYQLSYIDVKGALDALKVLGVSSEEDPTKITFPINFQQLPMVVRMPSPSVEQTGLLGATEMTKGAFDLSVSPSIASTLPGDANTSPTSQLLIYYHPAYPEQFSSVQKLLEEYVDRPARQIFVEGMVLEISEDGLEELGLNWEFREGNFETLIDSLNTPGTGENLQLTFDDLQEFDKNWAMNLKALVRDGKAEILSRPSVLTLNNRQATIRVGTDIPIATSQEQGLVKDISKLSFSFKYLATGISLNVMPRVNRTGDEVSMLVDTIVSAAVPNADLELKSSSGEVLASAPTVSTRRIQTYARIQNNMPFIIGGLISKEQQVIRNKIPLIGDIPYLGVLFRSKRSSTAKREVIIVLTPHVLAETDRRTLGRYMPKDEDKFDEFGNDLFRDTYRIRAEDVFDLTFLYENPRLKRYRELTERVFEEDFRIARVQPFNAFAEGRIPGENILVHRMIYEVIKRLSDGQKGEWLDQRVGLERLILFESEQIGGYSIAFLDQILTNLGDGITSDSFFDNNLNRALTITFRDNQQANLSGPVQVAPVPKIEVVHCADRQEWGRLLWELNQPDTDGTQRRAIVLEDRSDLIRLRRAVLLKKTVGLNGGTPMMTLTNFSLGKVLLIPEPKPSQTYPIDATVARYFFETEHYYGATVQTLDKSFQAVDEALEELDFSISN